MHNLIENYTTAVVRMCGTSWYEFMVLGGSDSLFAYLFHCGIFWRMCIVIILALKTVLKVAFGMIHFAALVWFVIVWYIVLWLPVPVAAQSKA